MCVSGSLLGQDVFEELQGSGLQVSFFLCDGVTFVGELLLQLLQLLQVLTNLLKSLRYCCEPAGGKRWMEKHGGRDRERGGKRKECEKMDDINEEVE